MHEAWFSLKNLCRGTVVHNRMSTSKNPILGATSELNFYWKGTHEYFKGRGHIEHRFAICLHIDQNKPHNPKYVNPFRKSQ